MTPGPGGSWLTELDYADDEKVQLDVAAIIASGRRIRCKRLLNRVTVLVLICGVCSVAATAGWLAATPGPAGRMAAGAQRSPQSSQPVTASNPDYDSGHAFGPFEQLPRAVPLVVQTSVRLGANFGAVQALAGDPGTAGGAWYVATSSWVMLFHVSAEGAVRSWPVLPARGLTSWSRYSTRAGLAVLPDGIVWIGVASTLVRVDTGSGRVTSWPIPSARPVRHRGIAPQLVASLAVNPADRVAMVMTNASAVRTFSPDSQTWSQVLLPAATGQPESAAFTRAGGLAIGFRATTKPRASGVLLDSGTGPILTATVPDARAISPYGRSSVVVGVSVPEVVSAVGMPQPLQLPGSYSALSHGGTPLVPLPDDRFATVIGTQILSFPAHATSATEATQAASLYETTPQECQSTGVLDAAPAEPSGSVATACPQGYQMLVTDALGDFWVVRRTANGVVELLTRG